MEANGVNKSASTRFVLTEETAEAIPAAFHPMDFFLSGRTLKFFRRIGQNRVLSYYGIIIQCT